MSVVIADSIRPGRSGCFFSDVPSARSAPVRQHRKRHKRIRVAVVGCGYWGPNLVRNFHALENCEVAAICDESVARLAEMHSAYPEARLETQFAKVLEDRSIQAIVLATPLRLHFPMACAAMAAGKHTFIEKPMASTSAECEELNSIAKETGLTLMVGHTFLYSGPVLTCSHLLDSRS